MVKGCCPVFMFSYPIVGRIAIVPQRATPKSVNNATPLIVTPLTQVTRMVLCVGYVLIVTSVAIALHWGL